MSNRAALIILDGWGIGEIQEDDAIYQAKTPYFDGLISNYPSATLTTYGTEVGLPPGQMGNSEVGHLNIGAGRIVYQSLARINKAIEEHTFEELPNMQKLVALAQKENRPKIHLLGLMSDGGVHSHVDHILAITKILSKQGLNAIYLHMFTDGRDTGPKMGRTYLQHLQDSLQDQPAKVASICGRYYAMDRDKRWDRIKVAYDAMVYGKGEYSNDLVQTLDDRYQADETDEFIKPIIATDLEQKPIATIEDDDIVLFCNFRTDRPRQLTEALAIRDIADANMRKLAVQLFTMTEYDERFTAANVLFDKKSIHNGLGVVLSHAGLKQLRAAETEKYAHVTFFFSGGEEKEYPGEERILIASPKVATYDLQPEMSAFELTKAVIENVEKSQPDFICLNYANTDMVGHTGIFEAAVKSAEAVDSCLSKLIPVLLDEEYEILIIADHGNSDKLRNTDGSPHTAHTINPVPSIYVSKRPISKAIKNGKLADVAPTILELMQIQKPPEMTGVSMI